MTGLALALGVMVVMAALALAWLALALEGVFKKQQREQVDVSIGTDQAVPGSRAGTFKK